MTWPAWMDDAACRGEDPAIFFPNVGSGRKALIDVCTPREKAVRRAAAICARCPVIEQCREWSKDMAYGIWAGEDKEA